MGKRTPEATVVAIQASLDAGKTQVDAAALAGVGLNTVKRLLDEARVSFPPQEVPAGPMRSNQRTAVLPRWIDRGYHPTYWDNVRLYGEEVAASIGRRDMAEARRAEV